MKMKRGDRFVIEEDEIAILEDVTESAPNERAARQIGIPILDESAMRLHDGHIGTGNLVAGELGRLGLSRAKLDCGRRWCATENVVDVEPAPFERVARRARAR